MKRSETRQRFNAKPRSGEKGAEDEEVNK